MSKARIIVIGHGKFASGIRSSLELFIGEQNESNFIDFTRGMSEVDLRNKITEQIDHDEDTVLFTDILGGTPYKESAEIAFNNDNVGVISGCNLSSLLETTYKDYENKEELMNDLVKITKSTAQIFQKDNISENEEDVNDFSDGI